MAWMGRVLLLLLLLLLLLVPLGVGPAISSVAGQAVNHTIVQSEQHAPSIWACGRHLTQLLSNRVSSFPCRRPPDCMSFAPPPPPPPPPHTHTHTTATQQTPPHQASACLVRTAHTQHSSLASSFRQQGDKAHASISAPQHQPLVLVPSACPLPAHGGTTGSPLANQYLSAIWLRCR
jgi:hypothetical protein